MENDVLKIASEIAFNEKAEGEAIYFYTNALEKIVDSSIPEETKSEVIAEIQEIISDELNHIEKLQKIYIFLTGIETNKD